MISFLSKKNHTKSTMTDKEYKDLEELAEQVVETLEYTDEDGVEHCFVVESKFPVGNETFAALLEVDPSIFDEDVEEKCCGQHHAQADGHSHHADGCCGQHHAQEDEHSHHADGCCGRHHAMEDKAEEDREEEANIILAKIIEDENGEIDIQVPTDAEFEKARLAYEALAEE